MTSSPRSRGLDQHGWAASLQRLQGDLGKTINSLSKSVEQKTASAMDGALGSWFKNDHGLIDLVDTKLRPLLIGYQDEMRLKINELLEQRIQQGHGGLDDVAPLDDAFRNAQIELDALARETYQSIDRTNLVASPAASLSTTDVPIRRRLIDWLLFRPKRSLQERILGTHDRPARSVPADVKAKRIGAKGLAEIQRRLTEYRKKYFVQSLRRLQRLTVGQYAARLDESITSALAERRTELEARKAELKGTMSAHLHVMYPIERSTAAHARHDHARRAAVDRVRRHGPRRPRDAGRSTARRTRQAGRKTHGHGAFRQEGRHSADADLKTVASRRSSSNRFQARARADRRRKIGRTSRSLEDRGRSETERARARHQPSRSKPEW